MTAFDSYSAYYDLLYRDKDYSAEAAYVLDLIRRAKPDARSVLELGCGTGLHAALLAEQGLKVAGIDLSTSMLAGAEKRRAELSPELQSRLEFRHGDIRTVQLAQQFDAVISLFHVISYQTSNEDLLRAFATAREHMTPDGCFIFDFWYGPAVLTQKPELRVLEMQNDAIRVCRVARPRTLVNTNTVEVNYSVQVERLSDHSLSRLEERHSMRYLFLPELELLLHAVGLEPITTAAWLTYDPPSADSWGAIVVAKRRPD